MSCFIFNYNDPSEKNEVIKANLREKEGQGQNFPIGTFFDSVRSKAIILYRLGEALTVDIFKPDATVAI